MLKDKVIKFIEENDLHGKNTSVIVQSVFKGLNSKYSRKKINKALYELQEDGLWEEKKNKLKPSNESLQLKGIFTLGKYGTGKITVNVNGEKKEYYVPARYSANAFDQSLVTYELEHREGKAPHAKITGVLATKLNKLYGVVMRIDGQLQFIPDDARFTGKVKLTNNELASLAEGKKCYVVVDNPRNLSLNKDVVGTIADKKQIFGNINSPMPNILAVLEQSGAPLHFNNETLAEATATPQMVTEEEISKVKDLRHLKFATIDPETCKDMDDAVYAEKWYKNGVHVGYIVYEATAHVSHYVKPDTALDKEAFMRGTSIYPAGGVIPMLPESLSNGICSLNEGEDRLALVTTMKIGKNGVISEYDICEAVINSKKKFSYEEVSALHHNDADTLQKYGDFKEDITNLYEAYHALAKNRAKEGRLHVQGYEPTIILNDEKDKVIDYKNDNNVDSHGVIEEIMVAVNHVKAKTLASLKIPNIYRTHDYPTEKKLGSMLMRVQQLGLKHEGFENGANNKAYQNLMSAAEKHPLKKVLSQLVVRSMQKAKYDISTEIGHFALALKDYSHTTSPIRRYSDIITHRSIVKVLDIYKQYAKNTSINANLSLSENLHLLKKYAAKELSTVQNENYVAAIAQHLNFVTERADDISRQTDQICAVLYMQNNIGKTYKGYVSTVDEYEVTVTLNDKNDPKHSDVIEVTIPSKEFYAPDGVRLENNYTQVVKNNSDEVLYSLGQEVEIKVYSANVNSRKILATTNLEKQIMVNHANEKTLVAQA